MQTPDMILDIATGRSRTELYWKNTQISWADLCQQLSETHRTAETFEDYCKATKQRQAEIKDVGGFVGGVLTGGRRKPEAVLNRGLLTLDMDSAPVGFWEDFSMIFDFAACAYTTHKHSPESPRYRLLIPLSEPVDPTKYEAISRWIAGKLGIDHFDHTGFQPSRLMYWPSTSKDGEYLFHVQQGELLRPEDILEKYHDYRDSALWPVGSKIHGRLQREITKQGDPLTKRGLIGAFCRTYDIGQAIETFLADRYELVAGSVENDRYTYTNGSTAGGLVVYDEKYAYSHHGTDPISGRLCNAFDLVRLHLFGLQDEDSKPGTVTTKLPSYSSMLKLAGGDELVKMQLGTDRLEEAEKVFGEAPDFSELSELSEQGDGAGVESAGLRETVRPGTLTDRSSLGVPELKAVSDNNEWLKQLKYDQKSELRSTTDNLLLILRNDKWLAGRFALDLFKNAITILGDLPWQPVDSRNVRGRRLKDIDNSGLRHYIETVYGINSRDKLKDARNLVAFENSYHPVLNYLSGLKWDGVARLDRLAVDYMGAENTEYTRAVTRKWFTACVARVHEPGCKMDYTLTFQGEEGIKKSTFFNLMGRPWFSDNFNFHMIGTKQAAEQIQGRWIIEIGELTGLATRELEGVKAYLARQTDEQRNAFKEELEEMPRQGVFGGSTNKRDFLKGTEGNRRFWVIPARVGEPYKDLNQLDAERDQVWAEAVHCYKAGETLYLNEELEAVSKAMQEEHTEKDERGPAIARYLDIKLPVNWYELPDYEKRNFIEAREESLLKGTEARDHVTASEILIECFGGFKRDVNNHNTKGIHDVMKKMPGWRPKQYKFKGTPVRGYVRKNGKYDK